MPRVTLSRRQAEGGHLPRVCMLTGVPTDDVKRKRFSRMLGITMTVEVPLIRDKHAHWLVRQLFASAGVVASLGLVVTGLLIMGDRNSEVTAGVVTAGGGVLFLVTLVGIAVLNQSAIRPVEITDREVTLAGVHEDFVFALEEERERDERECEERRRAKRRRAGRERES